MSKTDFILLWLLRWRLGRCYRPALADAVCDLLTRYAQSEQDRLEHGDMRAAWERARRERELQDFE